MKKIKSTSLAAVASLVALALPATSFALATPLNRNATNNASDAVAASDQTKLNNLKTRGATEINRRLNTLNKLSSVIASTTKLSATDKSNLTNEVNSAISGLNTLKTKLAADTDLATARTDVQSIYTEYRVYALLVPKVYLLKTSDVELTNDDKLDALAVKLQDRLNSAKAGTDVTTLQAKLNDMKTKTSDALNLANAVNAKVAPLQPSAYNGDHTILGGQRDQLKTAHQDNVAAYNDAKAIVSGLK